ncbi:MAG: hypothetical protein A2754_02045 [Candidatus Magasanikbacteria bacterium RIFCSPHIGHO2_01_FULL_47_8]|uniref:Bacterial spore germination immunoglobulin-like domain-containing protein n=1 Tax=Candidatus Magasanikbacteria bacterium RIFCSPHIGHO2_01_FULL_47_8 TaxID=1798673 RepID=A0A1F6ME60_9BACT|nr:MAG: hypothetical protein A2754_02045 [Candidatus Magasanikbacteria bacterium RIFCSPHIGHO2_01_FULL_47_8]
MQKKYLITLAFFLTACLGAFLFVVLDRKPDQDIGNELDKQNLIRVSNPRPNQIITSPLVVEGEARGTWFFEASFPVRLIDADGKELAVAVAQAQGEWMTENFVPFRTELRFTVVTTTPATLIFQKDNPSGLPEHDDELRMPVLLKPTATAERTIKLFYYNPLKDQDKTGNVLCSKQGLEAVERKIPLTISPIQDAVRLLIAGFLTSEEKARGLTTEFPLSGLNLESASLRNGVLTLALNDPENKTSGGSCRANFLWYQIEATAKQFKEVKNVQFTPKELFQP